jgi:hypothetical protein
MSTIPLIALETEWISENHSEVKWSADGDEFGTGSQKNLIVVEKNIMWYFLKLLYLSFMS